MTGRGRDREKERRNVSVTPLLLHPRRIGDSRGWFTETWSRARLEAAEVLADFCQDNHSFSAAAGTLRGLHFQCPPSAQAKLVRCSRGRIFDVAVDLRRGSPSYGRWVGAELSAEAGSQFFVPRGFAHGFLTLEPDCEVQYKVDAYYDPSVDAGIRWDDPQIGVVWPELAVSPVVSAKDQRLPSLADLDVDFPYDGTPLGPLQAISL
jgi:dTDP-4-dehydrorhamnose 3,5-epimerase